eukprot:5709434-Prymnesium_polylepis.1
MPWPLTAMRAPFAEQTPARHAGAPPRVERRTARAVECEGGLEGRPAGTRAPHMRAHAQRQRWGASHPERTSLSLYPGLRACTVWLCVRFLRFSLWLCLCHCASLAPPNPLQLSAYMPLSL